jgi:hypothetical protein
MKNNLIYQLGMMIGLEESFLDDLNLDYQKATDERRYEIMDILWMNFFELIEKMTVIKYQQYLAEAALGKRPLATDLYQQAEKEVRQYLYKTLTGEIEDEQKIEEIRRKIFSVLKAN